MSINATGSTTTTGSTGSTDSTSNASNPNSALNENDFLQLLTAQLKYQDPMSPTDTNSFLQEQAQFSTVEGITNLESSMTSLLNSQQMTQSLAMIGSQVTYTDSNGSAQTGVVSSVDSSSGTPSLVIGGADIDPSSVINVAPASQTGTTGTTSTDPTSDGTPGA